MPAARVSMRRVREILTLKCNVGPADPEVARVGVEHSTARLCLDRRSAALTDGAQEALLLAHSGAANRASPQGEEKLRTRYEHRARAAVYYFLERAPPDGGV